MMEYPSLQNVAFSRPYYSVAVTPGIKNCTIKMRFQTTFLTTSSIPNIVSILTKHVPNIFKCQCFNNKNFPFIEEVANTELGHLYEHILLEVLLDIAKDNGMLPVTYEGETSWNWKEDSRGIFHISIRGPMPSHELVEQAVSRTNLIMDHIIETGIIIDPVQAGKFVSS
jgi:hypothetical protein